jgi:hypothetical protein
MNWRSARWFLVLALAPVAGVPRVLAAQDSLRVITDTTRIQVLRLTDGSTVVGRVIDVRGDSIVVRTQSGQFTVARSAVRNVRERTASRMRGGQYWPADPNSTRLFFAPNASMLGEGEGYFCDIYVFFLCLTAGLHERVTFGGGMSVLPGVDIADNIFYLTPKVGLVTGEKVQVAVGALAGWTGAVRDDATSFGILYGVSTFGTEDQNFSAGIGYAYLDGEIANTPLLLGGVRLRLSRGTAFISENYLLPDSEGGLLSFGLRFFSERISGDVALLRLMLKDDDVFLPFVGLAVAFR